jgi:hypothetical protein
MSEESKMGEMTGSFGPSAKTCPTITPIPRVRRPVRARNIALAWVSDKSTQLRNHR